MIQVRGRHRLILYLSYRPTSQISNEKSPVFSIAEDTVESDFDEVVKDDELYQLFVSPQVRGSGVAASLIADAEERLAQSGVATAWLACAIGNERAARFYEKSGWHRVGTMVDPLETSIGKFPLEVWRFEKRLR